MPFHTDFLQKCLISQSVANSVDFLHELVQDLAFMLVTKMLQQQRKALGLLLLFVNQSGLNFDFTLLALDEGFVLLFLDSKLL